MCCPIYASLSESECCDIAGEQASMIRQQPSALLCFKFCSLRWGSLVGNTSPVKNTTGYDPASMSQKSQCMATRPSCPTFRLLVQRLLSYGMSHAPVEFVNFEAFSWWTLVITEVRPRAVWNQDLIHGRSQLWRRANQNRETIAGKSHLD